MTLTMLRLTAVQLSEAIGGGLLEEALTTGHGGSGYTFYLDEHRVAKGLPTNDRAVRLAARLGQEKRARLTGLRGDVLVLGCDERFDDVDVPRFVVEAALRSGIMRQETGTVTETGTTIETGTVTDH